MQDIVNDALDEAQSLETDKELDGDSTFGEPQIAVVGVGGAGNNTVNRLHQMNLDSATTIALNTDKQHLKMIESDTKLLIGKKITSGKGAGGDPQQGKRAAKSAQETLSEILADKDLVFLVAGMGGGTGTGATPVVANIAKEQGSMVLSMVNTPFDNERKRNEKARKGIENLQQHADSIIVLDNQQLQEYVPNLPINDAFSVMDQLVAETIKGITETITKPSLINLDFADLSSTLNNGGLSAMLVGETKDKNRAEEAVKDAINHPLLDFDHRNATGGLVHVIGGEEMTLDEADTIVTELTKRLDDSANVMWGARVRDDYQGKVRVMAILTGVTSEQIFGANSPTQQNTRSGENRSQSTDSSEIPQID